MAYIGLDADIEKLRLRFATKLYLSLGYTAYHRAFVNVRDGNRIPEIQVVNTTYYLDKLLDKGVGGLSFFVVEPLRPILDDNSLNAYVNIYFAVNLDTLYSTVTERAEEHLIRDVLKLVRYSKFNLIEAKTGLAAFTDDFDLVKPGDNMEPFFLAKFRTLVNHDINTC